MRRVIIGCATGAWGDSALSTEQLVNAGCDFIVYEALAEITMAILARAKAKAPSFGYATDIVSMIADHLCELRARGVRVVTNAGGVNVHGAATVLRAAAERADLELRVGVVEGDDLTERKELLRDLGDVDSGAALDPRTISVNAYLGARPIAAALDAGADIVVTGRCADSALTLGPLLHAFGWAADDYDRLSAGSLAGHLLECTTQSTGGLLTDWEDLDSWEDLGYPIAECHADGTFVLTKPEGTGGLVDRRTVAEQLIYEIGDPRAYLLPDVVCDWSGVELEELGPNRIAVRGARGRIPTPTLKATALHADGFKVTFLIGLAGRQAAAKARRLAADVLRRVERVLALHGWEALRATDVEILGAEDTYGPHARAQATREVVIKIALSHPKRRALAAVLREVPAFGLRVPGLMSGGAGLPRPTPIVRLRSYLVPRERVSVTVTVGEERLNLTPAQSAELSALPSPAPGAARRGPGWDPGEDAVTVPLVSVAHARSGDKGNHSNIGVLARHPDFVPLLDSELTAEAVRSWFAHRVQGSVERYALPGIDGFNFVLHDALGGGGVASLRFDPQGKAYAEQLLDMPVRVPRAWIARIGGSARSS